MEGVVLIYEINPDLNPVLVPKERVSKADSNNGVSEEWTKGVLNMS